ncbi:MULTISPECIES: hypothetical protein [unclassified Rhizobium]|uniref:hypothetical protein n=1 Tax=unclassified Rhizobium TaxID=2613769 RepID=UPI000EAA9397|nr:MULTISPECIES: hypothetical protein [unclassified Rhizobium]AYG65347.1 hypothetical protein CCGE531_04600 [Rhizobium sp. CCGE531]AYG71830.1 hypothetical protein CCGE532_04595 [Rhizobium sp. CCGE532]
MLKEAFSIARRNVVIYITYVLLLFAAQIADEYLKGSSSTVVSTFLLCTLSMNVQESILWNLDFKATVKHGDFKLLRFFFKPGGFSLLSFFFKSAALFLIALLIMLPFLYFLLKGRDLFSFALWSIFAGMLIFSAIFSIVMAFFGTWLPAGLHGVNSSFGDAFQRGKVRFLATYGRVLAGVTMPVLAAMAAVIVSAIFTGPDLLMDGRPNIPLAVVMIISLSFQVMGWTYISVVLTRRYMEAEHIDAPPAVKELLAVV